jgi:hypothetical protein
MRMMALRDRGLPATSCALGLMRPKAFKRI